MSLPEPFSYITFAILEVGRPTAGGNLAVFREVFGAPRKQGTPSKRASAKPAGSSYDDVVPRVGDEGSAHTPLADILGPRKRKRDQVEEENLAFA